MPYNQPIQRRLVAAVTKEYEQRGQVAPQQATQEQTPVMLPTVFFGMNEDYGNSTIKPDSKIRAFGFWPPSLSYANAVKQIYRNKIKLHVGLDNPPHDDVDDFYALTPARPHRICQFYSRSNSFYFAHVNAPTPTGYDGGKIRTYYRYVDIDGVATNDKENAYAAIRFGTPIVNNYAVAFCRRIEKEGLTLEEVDEEIDTTLAGKLKTKNVVVGLSPTITSNGYLQFTINSSAIQYYGEQ